MIAGFADDKKAEEIVILEMRKLVNFCDYFVIATGTSDRHVEAIARGVEQGLAKLGIKIPYKQGVNVSTWALLDLGDVVVHVFEGEARKFYGLEHLWQDAPKVRWKK